MGALFEQASQLQQQMEAAQQEAAETVVEGVAGGGAVKVRVTGGMDFQSVEIDPGAIDPADPEMLQDLVLAALHDAMSQVREVQESMLGLGGVDLGGLLGGEARSLGCLRRCGPGPDRRARTPPRRRARSPRSASRSTCCRCPATTPSGSPR